MTQRTLADQLQERVWGTCLIAAPLLLGASSFLWFNTTTVFAAGLLQLYAGFLFIPAVFGLARLLWDRAPHLAVFGGLVGVFGWVGGINYATIGLYEWAAGTAGADGITSAAIRKAPLNTGAVNPGEGIAASSALSNAVSGGTVGSVLSDGTVSSAVGGGTAGIETQLWPALQLPGLMMPIALLLLSIGLYRTGVAPKWVAVLLALGAIAFPLGRIPHFQPLYHAADLVILVPLAWVGLRYLNASLPRRVTLPVTA